MNVFVDKVELKKAGNEVRAVERGKRNRFPSPRSARPDSR
jgi:hypothetical protein